MSVSSEDGACPKCGKTWPTVTFKLAPVEHEGKNEGAPLMCDTCLAAESREGQIAEKIDEAQSNGPVLIRQVVVTGIKSGTNVTGYRYPTHVRRKALAITDLLVTFENGAEYVYENVPTVVAESWIEASSFGTHFIREIKNSYPCRKVN